MKFPSILPQLIMPGRELCRRFSRLRRKERRFHSDQMEIVVKRMKREIRIVRLTVAKTDRAEDFGNLPDRQAAAVTEEEIEVLEEDRQDPLEAVMAEAVDEDLELPHQRTSWTEFWRQC